MEENNPNKNSPIKDENSTDGMNLFDLTKGGETKDITGMPQKNTFSENPKDEVTDKIKKNPTQVIDDQVKTQETNDAKDIYPTPKEDEDEIPLDRQSAQLRSEPTIPREKSPTSLSSNKPATEESKPISEKPKRNTAKLILKFVLFIIGSFVFVYLFLNFPALWKKISYNYKESTGEKPQVQTIIPSDVDEDLLFLSTVTLYETPDINIKKDEEIKRGPTKDELGLRGIENNQLWVPKIDVKAPIVWDSPVDEATMMENLKYGVVHYKGTTKPGERAEDGEGNIFISGHSSYYWWDDGQFKTVFANLDELEVGDEIGVGYDDYGYVYRVYEKKVVNPDDVSVLAQDTDKNILSLMTCYPVGTNNQRLIVKAEYVARGKDEPEIIEETKEEITVEEPVTTTSPTPAPVETPIETQTPTQTPVQNIPSSYSKNFDVLDILPWNW